MNWTHSENINLSVDACLHFKNIVFLNVFGLHAFP